MNADHRAHDRVELERPCNLYVAKTNRYLPGRTGDVSAGGALVRLVGIACLAPGDRLGLAVAPDEALTVLHRSEMIDASVVRSVTTPDGGTVVAIRFDETAVFEGMPAAPQASARRAA